jgi:hypothetical protein
MADEPKVKVIPGDWCSHFSLGPFRQVMRFVEDCDDYTRELRFTHQSPVFKAHPGIESTFITDMAGLDYVFDAPPEELDRLEGDPGFGGLAFNVDMLGGVVPALMGHAGNHGPAREVVVEAMKRRASHFEPACLKVLNYGIPMLRRAARGERVNFQHAIHEAAVGIAFEWLFDLTPGPPGAGAQGWIKACFGLRSDRFLANVVARGASGLEGLLTNGRASVHRAYGDEWMEKIRRSAPYQEVFKNLKVVVEGRVREEHLPAHLMFAASFNATGGAWSTLHPALAQLSVDAVTRASLARELDGFHRSMQDLSDLRGTLAKLDALPFLDAFFLESMRLFGRPRHYYRRAMRAIDLPISTPPGEPARTVHIEQGTTLCLVATVARQDPTVWGDDASVFDPERYLRDDVEVERARQRGEVRRSLRERVRAFGPSPGGKNAYGCAGGDVGKRLWKTLAAALGRSTDWRLSPWPEPDVDAFDGVRPSRFDWIRG